MTTFNEDSLPDVEDEAPMPQSSQQSDQTVQRPRRRLNIWSGRRDKKTDAAVSALTTTASSREGRRWRIRVPVAKMRRQLLDNVEETLIELYPAAPAIAIASVFASFVIEGGVVEPLRLIKGVVLMLGIFVGITVFRRNYAAHNHQAAMIRGVTGLVVIGGFFAYLTMRHGHVLLPAVLFDFGLLMIVAPLLKQRGENIVDRRKLALDDARLDDRTRQLDRREAVIAQTEQDTLAMNNLVVQALERLNTAQERVDNTADHVNSASISLARATKNIDTLVSERVELLLPGKVAQEMVDEKEKSDQKIEFIRARLQKQVDEATAGFKEKERQYQAHIAQLVQEVSELREELNDPQHTVIHMTGRV